MPYSTRSTRWRRWANSRFAGKPDQLHLMINDVALRWVVTALFLFGAAECLHAIVAMPRPWTRIVSQSLHLAMALAMATMAWPWGMTLPTAGPARFFLVAGAWFIVGIFITAGHRLINAYHAVMMLAMSWMYAVMSGGLLPKLTDGAVPGGGHSGHAMPNMPNMNMPESAADSLQNPPLISGLNWLFAVGFGIATLIWVYRLVRCYSTDSTDDRRPFGIACQAMMAAGMSIMFAVML